MRSSLRLLMLMGLLAAVAVAAGPDSTAPSTGPAREDPVRANERLLEKWRADPNHRARLQHDLDRFWQMPAERRKLLRDFDRDLHHEDSATQQRLWGVLERYHVWLERLTPKQREWLDTIPGRIRDGLPIVGDLIGEQPLKLAAVKKLVDDQWLKQQPLSVQNKVNALSGTERVAEIALLREEQRQRHRIAVQNVTPGVKPPKRDRGPTKLTDYPEAVKSFVRDSLMPLLNEAERVELRESEKKPWPASARKLLQLAEKHPIPLPGPIGPVRMSDLPPHLQERLKKLPAPRVAALHDNEGKWPEFGEALLKAPLVNRSNVLTERVMPRKAADFPDELKEFVLKMELKPEEAKQLKAAEGKWPNYPREVLALAQKKGLTVPGMSLPAIPELWDRARAALPEVPAHLLSYFRMFELTPEQKRHFESLDPSEAREWIKAEYFKRKPRELKRLQQLDTRPRGPRPRFD